MITPKTPLFESKSDAEFRIRMIAHIKETYAEILGKDANLLDLPNGLEIVQSLVQERLYQLSSGKIDLRQNNAEAEKLAA
ncbi:MAG: hypothetical protein GX221_10575 [Candidatus Riflebacteria bacterium]|nr:hypothetical protein [Candidatus Riflebacteria bacterium]